MGLTRHPASLAHRHLFPKELQAKTCVGQGREESRGQRKYETEGTGYAHSWADEIAICLASVLLQFLYCWWQRWLQSALSTRRQNAGLVSHQIPGTPSGITGQCRTAAAGSAAVQRLALWRVKSQRCDLAYSHRGFLLFTASSHTGDVKSSHAADKLPVPSR